MTIQRMSRLDMILETSGIERRLTKPLPGRARQDPPAGRDGISGPSGVVGCPGRSVKAPPATGHLEEQVGDDAGFSEPRQVGGTLHAAWSPVVGHPLGRADGSAGARGEG